MDRENKQPLAASVKSEETRKLGLKMAAAKTLKAPVKSAWRSAAALAK
jgi:hypothetical protein